MIPTNDLSTLYDAYYFRHYSQAPYERSQKWLAVFAAIADLIQRDIQPRSVLDAGCAMGFLVEALRDRGIAADGIDVSAHAVAEVRDDIKPFCRVQSVLDPIAQRYDLIVCHEVMEHLSAADAERGVANLCAATDDVLWSSTPDGYAEDTHLNVQPVEYWASLFAQSGFYRDLEFSGGACLAPWAARYRLRRDPVPRIVSDYERRLWALTRETAALRGRALETARLLARHDQDRADRGDVVRLEATVAEQQEHLDALNERLLFMSDHENTLRQLLVDAHKQLLQRDVLLQTNTGSVPPALGGNDVTYAHAAVAWQQHAQSLQTLVDERTKWAQQAVSELEAWRDVANERQRLLETRGSRVKRLYRALRGSR